MKLFACIRLYMKGTVSLSNWIHVWLLVIASDVIDVTLVITSEKCTDGDYNQLWEKLNETVTNLFM